MIDIDLLREQPELFKASLTKRNLSSNIVDEFLALDESWRAQLQAVEQKRAEQKKLGAERKIDEAKALKDEISGLEDKLATLESERLALARKIPNLILEGVPEGKDESGNSTLREVGEKPTFDFEPKEYVELSEALGIIDTVRAAKVSGSRFGYLLGGAARLEFALIQLALTVVSDRALIQKLIADNKLNLPDTPFVPVIPPVMIKREMMEGMGYVERGGDEIYLLEKDDLYLVGTSEQSIGPMHAGETLTEAELPKRYIGFSTCFRREAGSYGKDTKGILRVHQFNKLEMFSISTPSAAPDEHKLLLAIEEYLMQQLRLPYRVLNICSGDLGDPAAAKFDIEAWFPGQQQGKGEYRETHSTSNTTDYQSRRLSIKYKATADNKTHFVHMLNGTVFSERPILAIIENYQTKEGTVRVPEVLIPYVGTAELSL